MAKPDVFNIYQNKSNLKWIVLVASVIISAGSIYYTNILVEKLKDREKSIIKLYAETLEYTANHSSALTEDISFISEQIMFQNNTIPMIIMDEDGEIYGHKNISLDSSRSETYLNKQLRNMAKQMEKQYSKILIQPLDPATGLPYFTQYLYYKNSNLLTQLTFYPFVQLSVIALFAFIAYLAFNYSRVAEQNRVWVGLAKETAHQLGTPISSLMAWVEYLKSEGQFSNSPIIEELNKDIHKLVLITERFSSIGSVPVLTEHNVKDVVERVVNYLRPRISRKVDINLTSMYNDTIASMHPPLFEWVIENIIKNAVDAMGGEGNIKINIIEGSDWKVFIDISDNGKGITPSKLKQVFNPGFTTKKRGWGLGLALAKRIVDVYHAGKVFVKSSEVNKGTTFRIVLNRES